MSVPRKASNSRREAVEGTAARKPASDGQRQSAMVGDRLQCKATSAAQGFPESDCHHPLGCADGDKTTSGALGEIRTPDPRIRSPVLYPAELRAHESFQWLSRVPKFLGTV